MQSSPVETPAAPLDPPATGPRRTFIVEGMCCGSEVRQIEAVLRPLSGVGTLSFDTINQRLRVDGPVPARHVVDAIRRLGMTARPEGEREVAKSWWQSHGRLVMGAWSGAFWAIGLALEWTMGERTMTSVLLALSAICGAWFVVPRAWASVRAGGTDMNVLMTLATVGAGIIGEWGEAASVMFLFAVAQFLETASLDRARAAIKALMDLAPVEAAVLRNGQEETVPVATVRVGECIRVRPGQKVPLDGRVVCGDSSVNQAPITGESMPVDKSPGHEVFAGSINQGGVLDVEVTTLVEDTTLARIVRSVEEAQASRAPSQSTVDRFARVYTPTVLALAGLLMVVPPLLDAGSWSMWFYRALAMLVVACPCALVISTPVAVVSGLAGAARAGVLIKGGVHLENAAAVTTLAFDKTGTLTEGRPVVSDIRPLNGASADYLLQAAAALERGSEHPIARAIIAAADARALPPLPTSNFLASPGRGVEGTVAGTRLYLGNERLAREQGFWTPDVATAADEIGLQGKTVVVLGHAGAPLGVIGVGDVVRAGAAAALRELRAGGVRRVLMLTGDNAGTAEAVARAVGIEEYRSALLPEDKVAVVRDLEAAGERVVFVGDGVNDAPALARATVGIAMGVAGTDVALETADIALMTDDLAKLPVALAICRQTVRIIRQNIAFSLVNKVVFIVLAATGWASLWMAVASDMGASLVVIVNGLRALRPPK